MSNSCVGNLFIVAAPSGGGKTSLVKQLVHSLDDIQVSISHTTRTPRPAEREGVDYFFVNEDCFQKMVEQAEFVEYARVFGHHYGTSVVQLHERLEAGIDVVLDIDWQGAMQIRRIFPLAVSIFIIPPSLQALKERLLNRRQDSAEVIKQRMQRAQEELSHYAEFDYLVVNDDFEKAADNLRAIVMANRLGISRQKNKLAKVLSFLMTSQ